MCQSNLRNVKITVAVEPKHLSTLILPWKLPLSSALFSRLPLQCNPSKSKLGNLKKSFCLQFVWSPPITRSSKKCEVSLHTYRIYSLVLYTLCSIISIYLRFITNTASWNFIQISTKLPELILSAVLASSLSIFSLSLPLNQASTFCLFNFFREFFSPFFFNYGWSNSVDTD